MLKYTLYKYQVGTKYFLLRVCDFGDRRTLIRERRQLSCQFAFNTTLFLMIYAGKSFDRLFSSVLLLVTFGLGIFLKRSKSRISLELFG